MNKLEKNMVAVVNGGYNWKQGNTEVKVDDGVTIVLLHGNEIFRKTPVMTSYSDGGWPTKTTATAYDGNCYTISGVVYDESDHDTDLDGALFFEVSTDYLAPTLMDVDGFNPDIVKTVADMIPTKCLIRISSHYVTDSGEQHEYMLNEFDVDFNTIIEDWLNEKLPVLTWFNETDNRLLCCSDNNDKNYLVAELIHE